MGFKDKAIKFQLPDNDLTVYVNTDHIVRVEVSNTVQGEPSITIYTVDGGYYLIDDANQVRRVAAFLGFGL